MKRSFISLSILILLAIQASSQSTDLKDIFLEAEAYYLFEEYNEALPLYLKIHREVPENDNINFKIGVCLLNDPYQKGKSISYLEQASDNINFKYRENNFRETAAPPEVIYYLGNAYLINNQLDKAEENYEHFMRILDEKIYDKELVEEQLRICERARKLQTLPVDYNRFGLPGVINSRFADINPVVSGNGNRLVYVSKMQFYDATFFSEKVDGEWQPPRNIIPELGVDGDVYPTCLSWDGNTMIIYRNDDFIGNLYVSNYVDGQWSAMEELSDINTKYWESHACFSKDGNTLYFTSNRKGGYGGLDIYMSKKQESGSWGKPENLGEVINSRYNEETPFITENGKKLYFSSYGHYNMGGYDIFFSLLNDKNEWGTPINLGYPINTSDDDLFFLPVNNGNNAYLSKYLPDGVGRHDIYYLDIFSENNPRLYLITGIIETEKRSIMDGDSVVIYLIDRESGDTVFTSKPDPGNQTFTLKAPKGDYDLLFSSPVFSDLVKRLQIDENTEKSGFEIAEPLNLEPKPYVPLMLTGDQSRIIIEDSVFQAVAGKPFRIRMRLIRDAVLFSSHIYQSDTIHQDTFEINRRRYSYELIPLEGENLIELIMEEENGDRSITNILLIAEKEVDDDIAYETLDSAGEVIVSLVPDRDTFDIFSADSIDSTNIAAPVVEPPSEADLILEELLKYSKEDLLDYLEKLDLDEKEIVSGEELMDHLTQQVDIDYTPEQLITALSDMIRDRSLESFIQYLETNGPGSLRDLVSKIDFEANRIESIQDLVNYLIDNAEELGISQAELQRLLIEMLADFTIAPILDVDPVTERAGIPSGVIILGLILAAGIFFILFFYRRKRKKEDNV